MINALHRSILRLLCFFSSLPVFLSFSSLSCADSKWDVFLPVLGLPWQPRRKKHTRRLCKQRRGLGCVFYKQQGPSLSQPASQPHVSRHGHWPVLLCCQGLLKGSQIEPCHCPDPQRDCQWVQLQRKLIRSQEDPAGYTL